jgi:hypothetical protein
MAGMKFVCRMNYYWLNEGGDLHTKPGLGDVQMRIITYNVP